MINNCSFWIYTPEHLKTSNTTWADYIREKMRFYSPATCSVFNHPMFRRIGVQLSYNPVKETP